MLQRTWDGTVLVKVTLSSYIDDDNDGGGSHPPPPYFAIHPRIHYPAFLLPRVTRYYAALGCERVAELLSSASTFPWFECPSVDGENASWDTVLWNRPLGVLADIATSRNNTLQLILHFSTPSTPLPPQLFPGQHEEDQTKAGYFAALKESDALKKTRRIMEMRRETQGALWETVKSGSLAGFESTLPNGDDSIEGMVPIKVYVEGRVRSGPVSLGVTVSEATQCILGAIQHNRIVTQGIILDPDMPLSVAFRHLCYPDNQLHLVLK